jgi:hypothetical protein
MMSRDGYPGLLIQWIRGRKLDVAARARAKARARTRTTNINFFSKG